jgi:hypothetical protein
LEPEPGEFFVTFVDAVDCEQFADVIVACSDQELIDKLFNKDSCLGGNINIDLMPPGEGYRTYSVFELCLPVSLRDSLAQVFDRASKMVQAEVSYCDTNARRSNGSIDHKEPIPKTEWDGHYVCPVPGVDQLEPGSLVKLIFHATAPVHATEKMWVRVTTIDDEDVTGTVDSYPAALTNLHHGDTVHFHKSHILRVAPPQKQEEMRNAMLN